MEPGPKLSAEQAAVVGFGAESGHLLVLARPGSGKTHTLAARVRRLLHDGVDPGHLLAMTFSNRAAGELRDRLPSGDIWAGTFHAICADILEHHGAAIGIRWPFRIVDEGRARELLLRAVAEAGFPLSPDESWRRRFLREVKSRIERRKRLGQERAAAVAGDRLDADVVAILDEYYCRLLREANAFDFDDLIVKAIQTLQEDELTAEALRTRIRHHFVDEFHDMSPEQYQLISLLAPPRWQSQVFVVGDPDQSIYEWRGAHANRMVERFRGDYRPVEFTLTVNFRSRAPIVAAADALMRDAGRTKRSQPHRSGTVPPFWRGFPTPQAEAQGVVATIESAMRSGKFTGFGAFAVLYRTHAIGNQIEAELLRAGIPLHRVQQERFFHGRDAQESLRYLELAYGMHEAGFEPALNWPRVIVDEVTMVRLRQLAAARDLRLAEIVNRVDELGDELSPLTRAAIRDFRDTIGQELGALVDLPMAAAIDPFLDVVKRRRSPIPRAEREALRDTLDLLALTLKDHVAALGSAMRDGRPLAIRALADPDCVAAAIIARHALVSYFDLSVDDISADEHASPDAFVLTLGEERGSGPQGIGLGPLVTRTVHLSVATRTWRLMQMLLMERETLDQGPFLIIDIETSTKLPERAEPIELGAMPFAGGAVRPGGLFKLIRPSSAAAIVPEATDTHGLRWSDVANAPGPREALPAVIALLHDNVVVGHNIEEFDLPVLRQSAQRAGLAYAAPLAIDTLRMAQRLWPEEASYRLEDLLRRSDPTAFQHHRAERDCQLVAGLFADLLQTARRERELDVLSECLPLVAVSIVTGGYDVAHDNALLAALGARALSMAHGTRHVDAWEAHTGTAENVALRSTLASYDSESPDEDDRWERFKQGWRTVVDAFCAGAQNLSIEHFLQYAALAQPIDTLPHDGRADWAGDRRSLPSSERVTLVTVHSAKGLQWPVVFVAGVEDDQFPLYRHESDGQLAEERRTLYVAMTRAQDRLLLFSVDERDGRGKKRSRFLEHLIGDTVAELGTRASAAARS